MMSVKWIKACKIWRRERIKTTGNFCRYRSYDDNDESNDRLRLKTYFQFSFTTVRNKILVKLNCFFLLLLLCYLLYLITLCKWMSKKIEVWDRNKQSFYSCKSCSFASFFLFFVLSPLVVAIECKYLLNSKIKLN